MTTTTTRIAVALGLVLAVFAGACQKATTETKAQQQQTTANAMAQSLQLPVPDNSYSVQQAAQAKPSGTYVQALLATIVNPLAQPMKESNMHLAQTIAEGQSGSDPLKFALPSFGGTSLTGAPGTGGTLVYTYTVSGQTYFAGSTTPSLTAGNLTFPLATVLTVSFSAQPGTTAGTLVRSITVTSAANNLTFATTIQSNGTVLPLGVTMTGNVSGKAVSGSWGPTGGFFFDLTGAKQCFATDLSNAGTGC